MSIQRGLEGKRTPCLGMSGKDERCRGPSCCCPGVWPTMGTCCLEGCGTGHDAITLLFHPSCKLGWSCCLFGLCDQRLFKPLLDCLSRKQTDKVSQVFFWCLSLLPLKMSSAVFLCTPQKLIGATSFLAQKSTSDLTTNAVPKMLFLFILFQWNACCCFPCLCLPFCTLQTWT